MANAPQRLRSLDGLRGLAALAVVVCHWQHFYFIGTARPDRFGPGQLPFQSVLWPLYSKGGLAVEFFFVLSGFVFYWLYSLAIRERTIGAWNFALLRFSRLYPLHLATLLWVAAWQPLYVSQHGSNYLYAWNDGWHFVLQLAFASSWGLDKGYSFNGPVWSVSAEVALYALFFLLTRFVGVRWWLLAIASTCGLALSMLNPDLGRGVLAFFLGGLAFLAYERIGSSPAAARITKAVAAAAIAGWIAPALVAVRPLGIGVSRFAPDVVFPLTVLAIALCERRWYTPGASASFLGDVSYGTYLLHFPLQLTVVVIFGALGLRLPADSGLFMIAFFAVLIAGAGWIHRAFEVPLQDALRRRYRRPDRSAAPAPAAGR